MRRNRRGASAIEFGLLLPWFILLVFSVVEYGWIFAQQANIISAVREGARYGVTQGDGSGCIADNVATDRVRATLTGLGYPSGAIAAGAYLQTCNPSGEQVLLTVEADVPYTPLTGLVPVPDTIHSEMTMLLEG